MNPGRSLCLEIRNAVTAAKPLTREGVRSADGRGGDGLVSPDRRPPGRTSATVHPEAFSASVSVSMETFLPWERSPCGAEAAAFGSRPCVQNRVQRPRALPVADCISLGSRRHACFFRARVCAHARAEARTRCQTRGGSSGWSRPGPRRRHAGLLSGHTRWHRELTRASPPRRSAVPAGERGLTVAQVARCTARRRATWTGQRTPERRPQGSPCPPEGGRRRDHTAAGEPEAPGDHAHRNRGRRGRPVLGVTRPTVRAQPVR